MQLKSVKDVARMALESIVNYALLWAKAFESADNLLVWYYAFLNMRVYGSKVCVRARVKWVT